MIARRIMPVKRTTSLHIERRACIKFECAREGGGGGISTDGVLIAAPSAVERAGQRETSDKERDSQRDIRAETLQDEGRRGE